MKFVVDDYIPFIKGVLEPFGNVVYAVPDDITPELVKDADALLVRTRTRIDRELLSGSSCKFVATATIGMDHFDVEWCRKNGVYLCNAPGCNAPAVAQYVFATIARLSVLKPEDTTIGIVGVGNVGRIVERWAKGMGMKVLAVDPPRQEHEAGAEWHTLEDVAAEADVITFHTPLVKGGKYPTYHLAGEAFFDRLAKKPVIINASRGPVVDNMAWLDAVRNQKTSASAVDVWEGEPMINLDLLDAADIATPHIAGYSLDGKIRATQMVLDSLSRHFGLPELRADSREAGQIPDAPSMKQIANSYNPFADTEIMRAALSRAHPDAQRRIIFEALRDNYNLREEVH